MSFTVIGPNMRMLSMRAFNINFRKIKTKNISFVLSIEKRFMKYDIGLEYDCLCKQIQIAGTDQPKANKNEYHQLIEK